MSATSAISIAYAPADAAPMNFLGAHMYDVKQMTNTPDAMSRSLSEIIRSGLVSFRFVRKLAI